MRLITIAAFVALTTIATTSEAEARSRHHHRRHAVLEAHEPSFLDRLQGRVNHRLYQVEAGLDYVTTGGRGGVWAIVDQEAAKAGVPRHIARGVIRVESGGNCRARNRSGASGAGQLMPRTARAMGARNPMDCRQNIAGSMRYLREALTRGGTGCAGISLYNLGTAARPRCTSYGRHVLRMASL